MGFSFLRWVVVLSLSFLPIGGCILRPPAIETIEAPADARLHVRDGVDVDYGTPFPTAGMHSVRWAEAGFYTKPQPLSRLVHSLEHGNIVIYYDQLEEEALKQLKAWSEEFPGPWEGIIIVPNWTLGKSIVLTAWEHRLVLKRFDHLAVRWFIDAYRGRGPERQTR